MILRILVILGLIVLGGGFIFFAANVIWLGTREFFKIYGSTAKVRSKTKAKSKAKAKVSAPSSVP